MNLIQSKSAIQTGGAGSQTLAFNAGVSAGSTLLVVAGSQNAADTLTITDDSGGVNVWVASTAILNQANTRLYRAFRCLSAKAGTRNITVNGIGSPVSFVAIQEYPAVTAFDQVASANGTNNAQDSGSAIPTSANQLLFGFVAGSPTSVNTLTQGAGWTQVETAIDNTNGFAYLTMYQTVSTIQVYNATSTTTVGKGGGLNWAAEILTFSIPSSGPNRLFIGSRTRPITHIDVAG